MKRILLTTILAALTLLATPLARAWTYNNGDVLLVFRNGSQDIEFDIGSVTNFLGHTNGYTITVPGWSSSLVTSEFGSFSGVDVALLASAGGTNWLSSPEPNTTAYNNSSQGSTTLANIINAVGNKTLYPLAIPTSGTNSYVIGVGGQYAASSYDYIVSNGHFSGIPQWGGNAPFAVEGAIPGYLDFWAVESTSVYPNPPPDQLVGTFTIDASGNLTFVAGPRASSITSVSRSGNISAVQFTTTVGNTYSVAFTNQLSSAKVWPVDTTTLVGDGKVDTLNHTNSSGTEFYKIRTQ